MSHTCCGLPFQVCNLGLRLPMEGVEALVGGIVVGSYWEFGVVGLWNWVAPEHSAGLCVGFVAGWEKTAVAPWGGASWFLGLLHGHGHLLGRVGMEACLSVRHATS